MVGQIRVNRQNPHRIFGDESLNLDVSAPEAVPVILRRAADQYRVSADELVAAWQDWTAGAPWRFVAQRLDRLADTLEFKLRQYR